MTGDPASQIDVGQLFTATQLGYDPSSGNGGITFGQGGANVPLGFDSNTMIDLASFQALVSGGDAASEIRLAAAVAVQLGKTLFFDSGTYIVGSVIRMAGGASWFAEPGTAVLQAASGLQTMIGICGSPPSITQAVAPIQDVKLNGLTFEGATTGGGAHAPLVVSWIATGLEITHCAIEHVSGIGLMLSNVTDSTVTDSSFSDIGNAPEATGSLNDAAQGIAFTSSEILQSSDNTVSSNHFTAIGLDAISATDQADFIASDNVMAGLNVLTGWSDWPQGAAGVYLSQDSGAEVLRNSIDGASGNGIDALKVSGLIIDSNAIVNSSEAGIAICDVTNARLLLNTSVNNNQLRDHFPHTGGITIAGDALNPSTTVLLSGNNSSDSQTDPTQDWGLQVDPGTTVSDLVVDGTNTFLGNKYGVSNVALALAGTQGVQCLEANTRLLTIKGERRICDLVVGDVLVLAATPWYAPICRLRTRRIDVAAHDVPTEVAPILIRRGAFGTGRPQEDILVSPDHSIFAGGYLVPARHLINGKTVLVSDVRVVEYWHVELPFHGVIIAQGLAVESFLDLESLARGRALGASHSGSGDALSQTWRDHAFAPQLRSGPELREIRRQVWRYAQEIGWSQVSGLRPCLLAGSSTIPCTSNGPDMKWEISKQFATVRLVSDTFKPGDVPGAESDDERCLGVAVASVAFDLVEQDVSDFECGEGWHAMELGWRWTAGETRLKVEGVSTLIVRTHPWNVNLVSSNSAGALENNLNVPLKPQASSFFGEQRNLTVAQKPQLVHDANQGTAIKAVSPGSHGRRRRRNDTGAVPRTLRQADH